MNAIQLIGHVTEAPDEAGWFTIEVGGEHRDLDIRVHLDGARGKILEYVRLGGQVGVLGALEPYPREGEGVYVLARDLFLLDPPREGEFPGPRRASETEGWLPPAAPRAPRGPTSGQRTGSGGAKKGGGTPW